MASLLSPITPKTTLHQARSLWFGHAECGLHRAWLSSFRGNGVIVVVQVGWQALTSCIDFQSQEVISRFISVTLRRVVLKPMPFVATYIKACIIPYVNYAGTSTIAGHVCLTGTAAFGVNNIRFSFSRTIGHLQHNSNFTQVPYTSLSFCCYCGELC